MRLTLRTLLAWLDGVLPGEEQVRLGEKVSASQTASELAERIQTVVKRQAIAAPAPEARGLADDANSVADFLDNTLPADQLATFERICLESDMHLAEVAACHTMLAAMAREPAMSPAPAVLQRLRKLVHDGFGQDQIATPDGSVLLSVRDGREESRETARALRAVLYPGVATVEGGLNGAAAEAGSMGNHEAAGAGGMAAEEPGHVALVGEGGTPFGEAFAGGDRRGTVGRRSSPTAWWLLLIAVSLVLVLVGVLSWTAFRGAGRRGPLQSKAGGERPNAVDPAPPAAPAIDAVAAAVAPVADPVADPVAARGGDGPAAPPPATAVAATAPRAGPVAAAEPNPQPQSNVPPPATVAAVTTAGMAAGGPARMEPSVAGGPATSLTGTSAPSPVVVVGGPLLRLVNRAGSKEWQYAAPGTSVLPGEELIVPPWSEAKLTAAGFEVSLLALTDVAFLIDRDGTPRLDMLFGRCLVGGSAAGRIGVTAGGLTGVIAASPASTVAIEVGTDRPGAGIITAGQRPFIWQPTAADGSVPGGERPREVPAGNAIVWRDGRASPAGSPPPARSDAPGFSEWVQSNAADALAAKISAGRPLLLSLRELAEHGRIENRMIATATLALIGQADDLVEQLAAEPGSRSALEEQQWLTLERMAVPATLARGGDAAAGLHRALSELAPQGEVDLLWDMARGFSDADIANGADRDLVEALDDPHLIVRRYAHKTLCEITRADATNSQKFKPDGRPDRRRDGVVWWRNQLEQGLIHR